MILELDCGNSFIKWRVIHAADATIVGGGIVDSDQALVGEVAALQSLRLTGCRIVSVRSEDETAALCALIAKALLWLPGLQSLRNKWQVCAMVMTITSASAWIAGSRYWVLSISPRGLPGH